MELDVHLIDPRWSSACNWQINGTSNPRCRVQILEMDIGLGLLAFNLGGHS